MGTVCSAMYSIEEFDSIYKSEEELDFRNTNLNLLETFINNSVDQFSLPTDTVIQDSQESCFVPIKSEEPHKSVVLEEKSIIKAHTKKKKRKKLKKYHCEECNKDFISEIILKIHSHKHTKEKPYGCEKCDKHFADPSTLRRHKNKKIPCMKKM